MALYSWEVVSTDRVSGLMVVKYIMPGNVDMTLNIPMPEFGEDVAAHVHYFSPIEQFKKREVIYAIFDVGLRGFNDTTNPKEDAIHAKPDLIAIDAAAEETQRKFINDHLRSLGLIE